MVTQQVLKLFFSYNRLTIISLDLKLSEKTLIRLAIMPSQMQKLNMRVATIDITLPSEEITFHEAYEPG